MWSRITKRPVRMGRSGSYFDGAMPDLLRPRIGSNREVQSTRKMDLSQSSNLRYSSFLAKPGIEWPGQNNGRLCKGWYPSTFVNKNTQKIHWASEATARGFSVPANTHKIRAIEATITWLIYCEPNMSSGCSGNRALRAKCAGSSIGAICAIVGSIIGSSGQGHGPVEWCWSDVGHSRSLQRIGQRSA